MGAEEGSKDTTRPEESEWEGGPLWKPRAASLQCEDSTRIPASWPGALQALQEGQDEVGWPVLLERVLNSVGERG